MDYNIIDNFYKNGFLLIIILLLNFACSSPIEEPTYNEDKKIVHEIIDGPIAEACPDV